MKDILFIVLLLSVQVSMAQVRHGDTTYFNAKLERAGANNYAYYQIATPDTTTMAPEKLVRLARYYHSGIKQMTGYVLANDTSKRIGMYTYYEEKGRPVRIYLYDYKRSIRYFINTVSYFKKIDACDADVDLGITLYLDGHMKHSGFYLSDNGSSPDEDRKMCTWKKFNPFTENIADLCDYDHGKINGRHFTYHGNGKIWREEYYKDGKRTGTWKRYWYNGNLRRKRVMKG